MAIGKTQTLFFVFEAFVFWLNLPCRARLAFLCLRTFVCISMKAAVELKVINIPD